VNEKVTDTTGERRVRVGTLEIAAVLFDFVNDEVLPGTGVTRADFWRGLEAMLAGFSARNTALLAKRDELQRRIDDCWLRDRSTLLDPVRHEHYLRHIGYLAEQPTDFRIDTVDTDVEIAQLAGPQLVVPVSNARYALNAANARWGSLYDALYGTDALAPVLPAGAAYDSARGEKVIRYTRELLNRIAPLQSASHVDATRYFLAGDALRVELRNGSVTQLLDPSAVAGWRGDPQAPEAILLKHNGLHVEIVLDRSHTIGKHDSAGVADVVMESALTTIQDLEDSVATVDADEKVGAYRNWLGLMKQDLEAPLQKGGRQIRRRLNPDRPFTAAHGARLKLPGRSLMLVRNVGHHMLTDAIAVDGAPVFETVIDAFVTVAIALHDIAGRRANSRLGSIYVVKPKLHGPEEVALAGALFDGVEETFGLPRNTVKIGVMDEERRTSANLQSCIHAVRHRLVFINTGFLDRTGDEIHTAMQAGPVLRKDAIKAERWLLAYERRNVEVGLTAGLDGRGQIGKGMWTAPDRMAEMLKSKAAHPKAGANTAWVPSPTAATLHALHYHEVNVRAAQAGIERELKERGVTAAQTLLGAPLQRSPLSAAEIQSELDNNIQGLLGYVVRWIDQGVGCSKVPDLHNVGLMEDRATLRISSQHVANWLHHGICSRGQVAGTIERMKGVVDEQNAADPAYAPLTGSLDAVAVDAARELIFEGRAQPNGYTEHILQRQRRRYKALQRRGVRRS
jgi:malate synthase